MKKSSFNFIIDNVQSRTEDWEGAKYLVVPVVAMVEGVHHGSGGPMFYPGDEIAKYPDAWNGRPLPVFHPTTLDGIPVSCNDPEIIAQQSVGHTFNFRYEDGKLKGEAWINIEKAKEIAPEILSIIKAHDRLEVSTGLFSDPETVPGTWNGEAYDAVLRNYRPDHLALLPGGQGACSWEDGCGVRANQQGECDMDTNEEKTSKLKEFWNSVRLFFGAATSHEEKRSALQSKIDIMDNSNWVHYVKAVYNNYFVYQAMPVNPSVGQSAKLWKQSYSMTNSEVEFTGDPTEVREVIDYKPVNNESVDINGKGESDMATKCCPEQVQLLIENEDTQFNEDDREWLENLDESAVKKLMPAEKSEIQKVVENTVKEIQAGNLPQQGLMLNKEGDAVKISPLTIEDPSASEGGEGGEGDQPATVEEFIANAPDEMQDVLKSGLEAHRAQKDRLVGAILANKHNRFTKEELDAMEVNQLTRMAELATPGVKDFSLKSGGPTIHADAGKIEVLEAPTFDDYVVKPAAN